MSAALSLLGLGPMGAPIAENLLAARGDLVVWNRTRSRAEALAERGAAVADTPRQAAADVTLTVLPDLPQVEALLDGDDGLLAGWADAGTTDPVLVVHGTVSPVAVAAFAARMLVDHGVHVLDAPLSGGTAGARDATLSVMVGGDAADFSRAAPVFAAIGTTVRHLGPSGSGAMAKACNQVVVAGTVTLVSEAMLLARSGGLDPAVLLELLLGGLARSAVLEQKGRNWVDEDFTPGGSARNQLKDLRFIADAARAGGLDLPATAVVTSLFEEVVDRGDGDLDHTGVYRALAARAGREEAATRTSPAAVVVMGVAGSGKSTTGLLLAEAIGGRFVDGDDLHPPASTAKMAAGTPLDDDDRQPWLRAVAEVLAGASDRTPVVVACSALRRSYRDLLRERAGLPVVFVHLHGSPELLAERIGARTGHFMAAGMLASQLTALEPLAPDEPGVVVDVGGAPEDVVSAALAHLRGAHRTRGQGRA
ncbi:gluconokinase, GntK/IdnK-type [Quadrisphaera oryzae]|uniref:gluconokinase, GntK/IdnK-type n=1 Tax=Quadrisphaera TaxID=317661 RepID=UPI001645278E|nr:gluconokinase, GntK/IdnK-type [Quadrisphaera sp. RL12-1S]MBC3763208.1 NAD-binding protein [Quadrisphaera sp. RL12-1S]